MTKILDRVIRLRNLIEWKTHTRGMLAATRLDSCMRKHDHRSKCALVLLEELGRGDGEDEESVGCSKMAERRPERSRCARGLEGRA